MRPGSSTPEHGQQYDLYGSYRYLLWPVVQQGGQDVIDVSMGNLSNRMLMSKMGYFNPHASDFILNVYAYLGPLAALLCVYPTLTGSELVLG